MSRAQRHGAMVPHRLQQAAGGRQVHHRGVETQLEGGRDELHHLKITYTYSSIGYMHRICDIYLSYLYIGYMHISEISLYHLVYGCISYAS